MNIKIETKNMIVGIDTSFTKQSKLTHFIGPIYVSGINAEIELKLP